MINFGKVSSYSKLPQKQQRQWLSAVIIKETFQTELMLQIYFNIFWHKYVTFLLAFSILAVLTTKFLGKIINFWFAETIKL